MCRRSCLVIALFLAATACGPTAGFGGDGDGDGDGNDPRDYDPSDPGTDSEYCGAQTETIPARNLGDPPDLLIVLDRSATMALSLDPSDPFGANRLTAVRDSLASVTQRYNENINFGLSVFPTDDGCEVAPGAPVAIAPESSSQVVSYVSGLDAGGSTPAHLALENAAALYAERPVNPAGRYVLFATDGAPNCSDSLDAAALTVQAVRDLEADGIHTFVLGFGDPLELPGDVLDQAALAGGVPRSGEPHYYQASDAGGLDAALSEIAGGAFIPSCSYALDSLPPDPELVTVSIDGDAVPRDPGHDGGWDYYPDDGTITFFGGACDRIEGGGAGQVSFVYGCPGPVVD